MFDTLKQDINRRLALSGGVRGGFGAWPVVFEPGMAAVICYRFGRWAKDLRLPIVGQLAKALYFPLFYATQMISGISIQAYTKIQPGFVVRNFSCVFVLAESIGRDFTVCEGVTVGNVRGHPRLPILGDNVYLEPGCKVLGAVTIGDNVIVRANSLILSDVPSNSIAVGNPARILPRDADA